MLLLPGSAVAQINLLATDPLLAAAYEGDTRRTRELLARGKSANVVEGGKRPFHTIIPGFLTRGGKPVMSFGVMGGDMQPQGHLQTVIRMVDYHQNPQAACCAPRWKVT